MVTKRETAILRDLAVSFSTKETELPAQIAKLKEKNHELTVQLGEAKAAILFAEAEKIADVPGPALLFGEDFPDAAMRKAVNFLMERRDGLCGVFCRSGERYRFVLGCASGGMKQTAAKLREAFKAGCGGDDRMASGSVAAAEEAIREVLA